MAKGGSLAIKSVVQGGMLVMEHFWDSPIHLYIFLLKHLEGNVIFFPPSLAQHSRRFFVLGGPAGILLN